MTEQSRYTARQPFKGEQAGTIYVDYANGYGTMILSREFTDSHETLVLDVVADLVAELEGLRDDIIDARELNRPWREVTYRCTDCGTEPTETFETTETEHHDIGDRKVEEVIHHHCCKACGSDQIEEIEP